MSASATPLSVPIVARDADAEYRRRRLLILGSVVAACSVVTICFCTWVAVTVSRVRASAAGDTGLNGNTPASSVAPVQGSLCP